MRCLAALLAGAISGCGAARPAPRTLPGPAPETPAELALARELGLLRATLGDLLVVPPAPGREAVLPALDEAARIEARLRIERAREGLARRAAGITRPALAREIAHARVLLDRAEALWAEPGGWRLASTLDRLPTRTRVALARGHPRDEASARLAQRLGEAARSVRVVNEYARGWAQTRLEGHARALLAPAASEPELRGALGAYRDALAATSTVGGRRLEASLALALGATVAPDLEALADAAASALATARQRIYGYALEVATTGAPDVDQRVAEALPVARRAGAEGAGVEDALPRLEAWLAEAGLPTRLRVEADGGRLAAASTATVTVPLDPELFAGLGGDAVLARLAVLAAPAVIEARVPERRVFPPDSTTTAALAHRLLARLAELGSGSASAATRLVVWSFLVERRARALAELELHRAGPGAALDVLIEEGWHEPVDARVVLDAAEIDPGRFAAPLAAEMMLRDIESCAGLPAEPCSRFARE